MKEKKMKMKDYELVWLEYWNEEDFCYHNLENYPFIHIAGGYNSFEENTIEVEIIEFFKAKNDTEAYQYVLDNHDLDVFSLFNINHKQIATDEGLITKSNKKESKNEKSNKCK